MIENFKIEPLTDSRFVRPARVSYRQDGVAKSWEVVQAHDSVAVLIYHEPKDCFILVKQFRPAVYLHDKKGYTYELCAGIVDKQSSLLQIAREEIEEECGYDVPPEAIEKVTSFLYIRWFCGLQTDAFLRKSRRLHESA